MGPALEILVVTPMFNDWMAAGSLLRELDKVAGSSDAEFSVVIIDDGSTEPGRLGPDVRPGHLRSVETVHLVTNLGHAAALAVGLAYVCDQKHADGVVVMDCDGEDQAGDVGRLVEAGQRAPGSAVLAHRAERSEGIVFRAAYRLYKILFRVLTGRPISFGNFCYLPWSLVRRLAHLPELSSHLAATIVQSGVPTVLVSTTRGSRYAGQSKMNFVSLVQLGLGAIAVDLRRVLVRSLIGLTLFAGALAGGMLTVGAIRLATNLAIPGWASNVFGALSVLLLQTIMFAVLLLFIDLKNRSLATAIPATSYGTRIDNVELVWGRQD